MELTQGKPESVAAPVEGQGRSTSQSQEAASSWESPSQPQVNEGSIGAPVEKIPPPFMLELFCGSAGVCAQFRLLGGKALGVDHHLKRGKLKAAAVKLDLTQQWVQDLISKEITMGRVAAVHLGPPCGTASRARNIPIRKMLRKAGAPNPQPLRSERFPEGFPWLKGINKLKVDSANALYSFAAKIANLCDANGVLFMIENPCNSLMWKTKFFRDLVQRFFFNVVDACEHGSQHKKGTAFLTNFFAARLQKRCSGDHAHSDWKVRRTADGARKFDTAAEAEYPNKLAREIAASFMDQLLVRVQDQSQHFMQC